MTLKLAKNWRFWAIGINVFMGHLSTLCITCQVATIGSILKFESKWLMSGRAPCIASILNYGRGDCKINGGDHKILGAFNGGGVTKFTVHTWHTSDGRDHKISIRQNREDCKIPSPLDTGDRKISPVNFAQFCGPPPIVNVASLSVRDIIANLAWQGPRYLIQHASRG